MSLSFVDTKDSPNMTSQSEDRLKKNKDGLKFDHQQTAKNEKEKHGNDFRDSNTETEYSHVTLKTLEIINKERIKKDREIWCCLQRNA